jgi:hypothetical protein
MGWRYEVIILGCMTLTIFFLRVVIFRFYETPKFLLSVGKEAEAIEVLHKIAKFNKAPAPTLTVEHLAAVDEGASQASIVKDVGQLTKAQRAKKALKATKRGVTNLKALFSNKLHTFIFVLLAIAYMASNATHGIKPSINVRRVITGRSTLQARICPSSCYRTVLLPAQRPSMAHTATT